MRLLELFEQITPRRVKHMEQEFSCGSCMYLALTLNQKYNWPLAGIFGEDEEGPYIFHVWVEPDKWTAVDIYGVHDKEELMSRWLEKSDVEVEYVRDVSPEWVRNISLDTIVSRGQEKTHHNTLKQAYRAMQHLLPQMQDEGLVEQITPRRQEEMEKDFTCGACAYLALTLNQKFGWPLVGIVTASDGDGQWDEGENVAHIWVEPPGFSKAVDITGVHDIGPFTKEWSDAGADFDGEYQYDIRPEWVRDLLRRGRRYFPSKDRLFYPDDTDYTDQRAWQRHHQSTLKQAYRAFELLIPQFVQHGFINESLVEGHPIRSYDPIVEKWIRQALKRPDADKLYLHGSQQEQDIFDPKTKGYEFSLLHFSKLTDPRFRDSPSQAEYFGHKLFLTKLKYKKPFDVRYPDSEAAQMYDKLVPDHYYEHRLSYEDLHEVVPAALERGYDMFVVFEIAVTTESYAVPNHEQVEIIDIYDAWDAKKVSDEEYMKGYRAWKAQQDQAEQYHGPLRADINESLADQLIDSKVARKFTYIAMAVKMHKDESVMANLVERAADEFLSRLEDGKYARLEDAEHDRNILLDMINKVADKLYLHDEIKQGSKTAQLLAGRVDLVKIGSFQVDLEPLSGSQAV